MRDQLAFMLNRFLILAWYSYTLRSVNLTAAKNQNFQFFNTGDNNMKLEINIADLDKSVHIKALQASQHTSAFLRLTGEGGDSFEGSFSQLRSEAQGDHNQAMLQLFRTSLTMIFLFYNMNEKVITLRELADFCKQVSLAFSLQNRKRGLDVEGIDVVHTVDPAFRLAAAAPSL